MFWPDPKGPISEVLENAIEFEFGSKDRDRKEMVDKLRGVLEDFIDNIYNKNIMDKSWQYLKAIINMLNMM